MSKRFELFAEFVRRIETALPAARLTVAETPLVELEDGVLYLGAHEGAASSEVDVIGHGVSRHRVEARWALEFVLQGGDGLARIGAIEDALATCAASFPPDDPVFRAIDISPAQYGIEALAGMAEIATALVEVDVVFFTELSTG